MNGTRYIRRSDGRFDSIIDRVMRQTRTEVDLVTLMEKKQTARDRLRQSWLAMQEERKLIA